ncbi:unnamed protein product [Cyprideis torosa]|uniref:Uncharacterized protein n=1 Tax=Cyprideis torosa TaxID=163714 RepID=A0A7R8WI98_9CRUS|nr:unnamed protein product [Cyprideis torosa]CAG0900473.1 unnamed protein product [Cyprideis torosa]
MDANGHSSSMNQAGWVERSSSLPKDLKEFTILCNTKNGLVGRVIRCTLSGLLEKGYRANEFKALSMMIQVVVNLTNSGGPSPQTRERRQRRTANVLGVRRRETFRRRHLSAQVLRDVAVVDQRASVIPLPYPPSMMEEEVVRSPTERLSAIPLPCPPGMISNGDEEEVVHSSVETSSAVSTEEMNWEHGVSTPFSPSPVHQAGEWEQGVDTPHSPSPSAEERLNIKQEPITPAESPTPSSTYEEEEEEEEGQSEGSPLKEEVDTPVASPSSCPAEGEGDEEEEEEEMGTQAEGPSTFSQGCLSYIQSVTQAWTSMEEEQNVEVGYTTPTSTSRQPPLLPTPPPAPRRELSDMSMYLLTITIGVLENTCNEETGQSKKQRRAQELTVICNAGRMESIDEDDNMPRGPVPTLGDAKGPQLEEDERQVPHCTLTLDQKTSQVFTSPSPTPEGRHIPLQITSRGRKRGRKGKRALRYPSSLPLPPPTPPKSGVPRCTLTLDQKTSQVFTSPSHPGRTSHPPSRGV